MDDIVERAYAYLASRRQSGDSLITEMAHEIERLRDDKAAISTTASSYLHEIERLKAEIELVSK